MAQITARLRLKRPAWRLSNPMTTRELRARMRNPRAFIILAAYLLVLTGVTYGVYLRSGGGATYSYGYNSYTVTTTTGGISFGPTQSYKLGQNIFLSLTLAVLLLAALIAPALTAGAISREREGRTYDLLFATPIGARRVITGKVLSALGYIFLLDLAALPLLCVVFVFGGVALANLIAAYALIIATSAAIGMLGIFFSALTRRTALAAILTYSVVGLLFFGTILFSSFWQAGIISSINTPVRTDTANLSKFDWTRKILIASPIATAGAILAPDAPMLTDAGEWSLYPNSQLFSGTSRVSQQYSIANRVSADYRPLWFFTVLYYAIGTVILFGLSILFARPYKPRLPFARRRTKDVPPAPPQISTTPEPRQPQPKALG